MSNKIHIIAERPTAGNIEIETFEHISQANECFRNLCKDQGLTEKEAQYSLDENYAENGDWELYLYTAFLPSPEIPADEKAANIVIKNPSILPN